MFKGSVHIGRFTREKFTSLPLKRNIFQIYAIRRADMPPSTNKTDERVVRRGRREDGAKTGDPRETALID